MSQHFNIVIFTAALESYAQEVISKLDPEGLYVSQKLYRQHMSYDKKGLPHKNLLSISNDLTKILIIDNIDDNF